MKKASQIKSNVGDKANAPFPTRLRLLLERENMTQGELAELLGIARQSANQYCLGLFSPDPEKLCKIAQHFNVTTDYLLGLTDVSSAEPNMKIVREITGLSETAVEQLRTMNDKVCLSENYPNVKPINVLSEMISQKDFFNFMSFAMQGYIIRLEKEVDNK